VLEDLAQMIARGQKTSSQIIAPAAIQGGYPLSSSQRRLWVLSQFEEASIAYHMPAVYLCEGDLDSFALDQAFRMLIQRHESLRTIFKEDEQGEIKQFIQTLGTSRYSIVYHDLRSAPSRREQIDLLLQRSFSTGFNLDAGPLLHTSLYQLSADKWVLSLVMHHIVSDGWSMQILTRELWQLYSACIDGKPNPLQPLRIQYKDYAAWQQAQLESGSLQRHKDYWLKQFAGDLPVLELPGDRVRPAKKTYNGAV